MTLHEFAQEQLKPFGENNDYYDMSPEGAGQFWLRAFVRLVRSKASQQPIMRGLWYSEPIRTADSFNEVVRDLRLEEPEP